MRFVVLSSSRGSVFGAVLDAIQHGHLSAQCMGLVTDSDARGCIDKAKEARVPFVVVPKIPGEQREEYDQKIDTAILSLLKEKRDTDIVACMGWMWVLSSEFIRQWNDRILNVHPSLLPDFGGKGMYGHHVHEAVIASGKKESGMTIHLVNDGVDTGPVLIQESCVVQKEDTPETLALRVGALEKEWYPKTLQLIHEGKILL